MADLMDWLRSFFCRHDWKAYEIGGYETSDEHFRIEIGRRTIHQCAKCGRVSTTSAKVQEKQRG